MAAVTKGYIELGTGSEGKRSFVCYAREALAMGEPVVISATPSPDSRWRYAVDQAVAQVDVFGIVLNESVPAGGTVDVLQEGELEGFEGLTPGTYLTVVGGQLDDTAPVAGVQGQFYCLNETTVLKRF